MSCATDINMFFTLIQIGLQRQEFELSSNLRPQKAQQGITVDEETPWNKYRKS